MDSKKQTIRLLSGIFTVFLLIGIGFTWFVNHTVNQLAERFRVVPLDEAQHILFRADISATLLPLPAIHLSNVSITDLRYPNAEPLLSAPTLDLRLSLLSLLQGQIAVQSLIVNNAVITITQNDNGIDNWNFFLDGRSPISLLESFAFLQNLHIEQLRIMHSHLVYEQEDAGTKQYWNILDLAWKANASKTHALITLLSEQQDVMGEITVNQSAGQNTRIALTVKANDLASFITFFSGYRTSSWSSGFYEKPLRLRAEAVSSHLGLLVQSFSLTAGQNEIDGQALLAPHSYFKINAPHFDPNRWLITKSSPSTEQNPSLLASLLQTFSGLIDSDLLISLDNQETFRAHIHQNHATISPCLPASVKPLIAQWFSTPLEEKLPQSQSWCIGSAASNEPIRTPTTNRIAEHYQQFFNGGITSELEI